MRRAAADGEEFLPSLRGWCVGSEDHRKELLAQMHAGPEHFGKEMRESCEEKARRLIQAELKELGWKAADLERAAKDYPKKKEVSAAP